MSSAGHNKMFGVSTLSGFAAVFMLSAYLMGCGGSQTTSLAGNGSGGSGSGSGGSGSGSGKPSPDYGEGTGASGQTGPPKFLYANPLPGGGPFAQTIQANGTLKAAQSVPSNNTDPQTMAIDPSGSFLFQTALGFANAQGGIYAYAINRSGGSLTQASGSPYLTNLSFYSAVVDIQGKFLFAQGPSSVYVFTIQPGTGTLTQISGSPFPAAAPTIVSSQAANRAAVDQTNHFLYISTSAGIYAYSIDPASGQLSSISGSPFAANVKNSFAIVITPSNQFLYQTTMAGNNNPQSPNGFYGYSINQTSGALTALPGSPFSQGQCGNNVFSVSNAPDNMTIASAGKFLYLANCGTYSVDANTGALTQVSNFVPGDWPVIDPSGNFLWASTSAQNCFHCNLGVTAYQVDPSSGALTAVPNSFFVLTNSFVGSVGSLAITK